MHHPVHRAARPVTAATSLVAVLAALLAMLAVLLPLPAAHAATVTTPTVTLTTVPGGSAGVGQPVVLVATVGPATTTGTVTFSDSLTVLASNVPVVDGTARATVTTLAAGPHSLDAVLYSPTGLADTGWVPFQVVATTSTWVSLTPSTFTPVLGAPLTLTAQVSPGRSGTVIFYDGVHVLAIRPLVNGRAALSVSSLSAGLHSVTAAYACGTPLCTDRQISAPLPLTVRHLVSLAASTSTVAYNTTPVTLTAVVTPAPTSGSASFFDGVRQIGGPVPLVGGTAHLTLSRLPSGSHSLTVVYVGNLSGDTATSARVVVTVTRIVTSIHLTATSVPNGPFLTGVDFSTVLSPDPLVPGQATLYEADCPTCTPRVSDNPMKRKGDGSFYARFSNLIGSTYYFFVRFTPDDTADYTSSVSGLVAVAF